MFKPLRLAFLTLLLTASAHTAAQDDKPITVFAAASLTDVLQNQAKIWARANNTRVPRLSFAASAIMARQIRAGAPAHVFISANPHWIHYLIEAQKTNGTPITVASNQLVFVAPMHHNTRPQAAPNRTEFLAMAGNKRLALADPAIAPAGAYARTYLQNLKLWDILRHQLAFGSNVRQTLLLIEQGNLMGFVYKSDAAQSNLVRPVFTVPEAQSGTIRYTAVQTDTAHHKAAAFIQFLTTLKAREIWKQGGFLAIAPE